jgi:tetratricopeptide (TPR) repeat protein
MNEDTILAKRNAALKTKDSRNTLGSLVTLARENPKSWTVSNLIVDDIINIASSLEDWKAAAWAANLAIKLDRYPEHFRIQERYYQQRSKGLHAQAIQYLLEQELKNQPHKGLAYFNAGKRYSEIGDADMAWKCFNNSVTHSLSEGTRTDDVRREMSNLLIAHGRPKQAVMLLLQAIVEADSHPSSAPKSLEKLLRQAITEAGINLRKAAHRQFPSMLLDRLRNKGLAEAQAYLNQVLTEAHQ